MRIKVVIFVAIAISCSSCVLKNNDGINNLACQKVSINNCAALHSVALGIFGGDKKKADTLVKEGCGTGKQYYWWQKSYKCTFGDYSFILPQEESVADEVIVERNNKLILSASEQVWMGYPKKNKDILIFREQKRPFIEVIGQSLSIRLPTEDGSIVEYTDLNLDGAFDIRFTRSNNMNIKEVYYKGEWFQSVERGCISYKGNLVPVLFKDDVFTIVDDSEKCNEQ